MRSESTFVPALLSERGNKISQNILAVFGGAILLAVLAQIYFRLPFTPIPVTGQTFGVLPFLPGEILKIIVASFIASRFFQHKACG